MLICHTVCIASSLKDFCHACFWPWHLQGTSVHSLLVKFCPKMTLAFEALPNIYTYVCNTWNHLEKLTSTKPFNQIKDQQYQ